MQGFKRRLLCLAYAVLRTDPMASGMLGKHVAIELPPLLFRCIAGLLPDNRQKKLMLPHPQWHFSLTVWALKPILLVSWGFLGTHPSKKVVRSAWARLHHLKSQVRRTGVRRWHHHIHTDKKDSTLDSGHVWVQVSKGWRWWGAYNPLGGLKKGGERE